MDDGLLHGLRWVLLADEVSWPAELQRVLAPVADDPDRLAEVHALLVGRLADAAPLYRARMVAMVDAAAAALARAQAVATQPLGELILEVVAAEDRIAALRAELAEVEARREAVIQRLAGRLTPGQPADVGGWRAELTGARRTAVVVEPSAVPFDCCRLVPDEARLAARLAATGQAPPGTVVVSEPARVTLVRVGE